MCNLLQEVEPAFSDWLSGFSGMEVRLSHKLADGLDIFGRHYANRMFALFADLNKCGHNFHRYKKSDTGSALHLFLNRGQIRFGL